MNIILMTILLTLLGAGLVVLLVWLSVVSCKSIKFKKDSILNFNDLEKKNEETITSLYREIEMVYQRVEENKKSFETSILEVYNKMAHAEEELHREVINNIYNRIDEVNRDTTNHTEEVNRVLQEQFKNVWTHFSETEKSADSRFDKQFRALTDIIGKEAKIMEQKLADQKLEGYNLALLQKSKK
jgi:hypothetical protein